jgi:hypothetical protein
LQFFHRFWNNYDLLKIGAVHYCSFIHFYVMSLGLILRSKPQKEMEASIEAGILAL